MRLANIEVSGSTHVAVLVGEEWVDVTAQNHPTLTDVTRFITLGDEARLLADRCVRTASTRLTREEVVFRSPVLSPGKILGVGMNYHSFVAAASRRKSALPPSRIWFYRPTTCLNGPYDDVWLPSVPSELEYEGELAVVIGRRCRSVSAADAASIIAGFTVGNDFTLRDKISESLVFAKSYDTHTPLGPWLVTAEEIADPHTLGLQTWVNGQLRQMSTTADMIANCYELIAQLSQICTLHPGDVILTGTPDGTGLLQTPPTVLKAGDTVRVEIEQIGAIENRVVSEPL